MKVSLARVALLIALCAAIAVLSAYAEPSRAESELDVYDVEGDDPSPSFSDDETGEGESDAEPEPEPAFEPEPDIEPDKKLRIPLAERISVKFDGSAVLFPGDSLRAHAEITPLHAADQAISWSTSAPKRVLVDGDGLITVKPSAKVGEDGLYVDIWAKATDGSLVMDCATLRVLPKLTRLKLLDRELVVSAGASEHSRALPVVIAPASLSGVVSVYWTSSNPGVVRVEPSGAMGEVGVISWGERPGSATITATAEGGERLSDDMVVIVRHTVAEIRIEGSSFIERGEHAQLNAVCLDAAGDRMTDIGVDWSLRERVPGVTVDADGLLAVDRYCVADGFTVVCQARDEGAASATLAVSVGANERARRFMAFPTETR